jgi:quercetin dioxygenase-like cupin family protein
MKLAHGRQEGAESSPKSDTFIGEVWSDPVLADTGIAVNTIAFTPGAHTFWHSHENGQLLQVTAGEGWVCTSGEEPTRIRKGDTVWVPAGERHWHGATADTYMVHVATSLGVTRWEHPLEPGVYPASGN